MKKKITNINMSKKGFENFIEQLNKVKVVQVGDTVRVNEHLENSDGIIFHIKEKDGWIIKLKI